ncbi:hypothetical protein FXN63_11945 [Pigmentiphaga aceris]|uniref:YCII-related domain-containing protein n=1 Tax=Pigmentiphaga aceris TaxID=1940612 RepID=A0A5C0AYJ0_9BURK|nr:YciI family protein [Pigmentiphaga aceris]QEI06463.1 hypothetical protein FXN63_11945 [Pigmentiphaga aceris]
MLFAITLNYIRPIEEVQVHLDAHKHWLVQAIKSGHILFAGPLEPGPGGFILAVAENISDIQDLIANDPFDIQQVAAFDIQACHPAIRAEKFPAHWASGAKAV